MKKCISIINVINIQKNLETTVIVLAKALVRRAILNKIKEKIRTNSKIVVKNNIMTDKIQHLHLRT